LNVKIVGIVGGGTMGRGIAVACAAAGFEVLIVDRTPEMTGRSLTEIGEELDQDIAKWRRTESEKKVALGRLRAADSLTEFTRTHLAIEAVPEDLELKCRLFEELDRVCSADALLASNTSTLSITQIAAHTRRPERVIGLHFLYPAPRVPLVEVVRGLSTSDTAFAAAREFVSALGKTPVEVFEYPGYVSTRVILPFLNEAMHVVMEGVASAEAVDTALKLGYGLPVGPLALADRMGLDEVMRWMQYLFSELGDLKYRPCPLLRKMIRAGRLGVKSRRGFFEYDENGQLRNPGAPS
jgi:3-hydroxybutyryl-CoA dehydrogenase